MFIWYAAGLFIAIFLAWIAAMLHASVHAPVGGLSIGVGIFLGVMLSTLAMLTKVRKTRGLIVGAVLLAIVTVLAQHAWLYIDFRRQWNAQLAKAPRFDEFDSKAPTAVEYFAHELTPARGALWCIDATLIMVVAVGTLMLLERKLREFGLTTDANSQPPAPGP